MGSGGESGWPVLTLLKIHVSKSHVFVSESHTFGGVGVEREVCGGGWADPNILRLLRNIPLYVWL